MDKSIPVERISVQDFGGCNFCSKRVATEVIQITLFEWAAVRTCDKCAIAISSALHNASQNVMDLRKEP